MTTLLGMCSTFDLYGCCGTIVHVATCSILTSSYMPIHINMCYRNLIHFSHTHTHTHTHTHIKKCTAVSGSEIPEEEWRATFDGSTSTSKTPGRD